MKQAVLKFVSEPRIADAIATHLVDDTFLTTLVARFIRHVIEKGSSDKAKMEERSSS